MSHNFSDPESEPEPEAASADSLNSEKWEAFVEGRLTEEEEAAFLENLNSDLTTRLLTISPAANLNKPPEPREHPEWRHFRNLVAQRDFAAAASLLEEIPGLIDERSGIGETVLHWLAVENDQAGVEWLHAKGADLNSSNDFGTPLLFEAAQLGYRELCLWLIGHGADPGRKNAESQTLAEFLRESGHQDMVEFLASHLPPSAQE